MQIWLFQFHKGTIKTQEDTYQFYQLNIISIP